VLSPGPGEGKTTVASNIAIALSQTGLNVLLVDSDIRRGRLHKSYDAENDKGLGHYLTNGLQIADVIQKTSIPGVSIVTRGDSIINSSQLFSSPRMAEFIREARSRFDIIVYDTPPLTFISDASILVSQVKGALLVVRSGVTNTRVLPKAIKMIQDASQKFIGIALNSAGSGNDSYYQKYYRKN